MTILILPRDYYCNLLKVVICISTVLTVVTNLHVHLHLHGFVMLCTHKFGVAYYVTLTVHKL